MTQQAVLTNHLSETVVAGQRLGRHIQHDPRSRDYPAAQAPKVISVKHTATNLPLNQGHIGSCTANALCGALDSAPDLGTRVFGEPDAIALYTLETKEEGKPYPAFDPGGTGLRVCKAARELGWISSYRHAFGIDHALQALVLRPVITGIAWYSSFDQPAPGTGLVEIAADATVRGGHEIVADEIDAPNSLVWFWNSWGPQWGVGGRFCMSFSTWEQLLSERGDVTVPMI